MRVERVQGGEGDIHSVAGVSGSAVMEVPTRATMNTSATPMFPRVHESTGCKLFKSSPLSFDLQRRMADWFSDGGKRSV